MARRRGNNEGSITFHKKSGLWMGRIFVGYDNEGKPIRKVMYAKSKTELQEKIRNVLYERQAGTYVEPSRLTVGEWVISYLETYVRPSVRVKTFTTYEDMAKKHIVPALGTRLLQQLQTPEIQRFYNEKLEAGRLDGKGGLSSRAIHMMHQVISGALKQALAEGRIQRNVAEAVKLPPLKYKSMRSLSREELAELMKAVREDRLHAAFEVELATGLRRGELLALRWQDVDLNKKVIHVRRTLKRVRAEGGERRTKLVFEEPKTDKSRRTITLTETAVKALKLHRVRQSEEKLRVGEAYQDNGLVFATPLGRPIDPDGFYKHFSKILKKAGISHRSFHNCRHTVATVLLEEGVNPKVVQELLGHARVGITLDIYSHVDMKTMQQATDKLEEALQKARVER